MIKRILLGILWFVVSVIGIKIAAILIAWLLPQVGIGGFPVDAVASLFILLAFVYCLIAVIQDNWNWLTRN